MEKKFVLKSNSPNKLTPRGNRCGHNPKSSRLVPVVPISKGLGGLPRILSLAAERTKIWYDQLATNPDLNSKNDRQTRSERREAIIIVIETLLKHLDIVSLNIGYPSKHGFIDIDMQTIMRESGLGQRRCERAIGNLKKAGFLFVKQPRIKKAPGKYVALRAIRMFTWAFFTWLGLKGMLIKEMKKAAMRRTAQLVRHIRTSIAPNFNKSVKPKPNQADEKNKELKRKWMKAFVSYTRQGMNVDQAQKATNQDFGFPANWSHGRELPSK